MPFLLLSLICWSGAALGFGTFFSFFIDWSPERKPLSSLGLTLLLGISILGFMALFLNFFVPLSYGINTSVLLLGWLTLVANRKRLQLCCGKKQFVLWSLVTLATALVATASHYNIDTGFYHLPSVVLSRIYPALPGIGNVAGPFGHVSTWFLLESLLSLPGLGLSAPFSANSLFGIAFIIFLFEAEPHASRWGRAFILLCFFSLNHVILGLGGLTPDFPSYVLGSVIWFWFLNSLESSLLETKKLSLGLLLTIFAFTIKTSNLLILIPWVGWLYFGVQKTTLLTLRFSKTLVFFGVSFLFCWTLRSLLTSGCLLYPKSETCFSQLPWAMPEQVVQGWLADVKYHLCGVRELGSIFSEKACVEEWLRRILKEPLLKFVTAFSGIAFICCIFYGYTKKRRPPQNLSLSVIYRAGLIVLVCFAVWLFMSPNLRFAPWLFVASGGLFFGVLIHWMDVPFKTRNTLFYFSLLWGLLFSIRSALITRSTD